MANNILEQLATGKTLVFTEVIAYIDQQYQFTPTAFKNGNQYNEAGQNSGSCKVFAFAKLQNLTQEQTLQLFAGYYQDVLNTPEAEDHQNIRNFMSYGWGGIQFEGEALK